MDHFDLLNGRKPAILALTNDSVFYGYSIGVEGKTVGEVIFNTTLTGYQEILTDPSYAEQIITFTYPHIGNVGVNVDDQESCRIWAAGLIIRELSPIVSNWRAQQALSDYLKSEEIVGIAGIDTRRLVRLIREQEGPLYGCIIAGNNVSVELALKKARATYKKLKEKDLAKIVSTTKAQTWQEGSWNQVSKTKISFQSYQVVVYDFGLKQQILRILVDHGCSVTVVPAKTTVDEVIALNPDGIVFANGPGDPADCNYAIVTIRQILEKGIPLLGICLGFQLLALACGARTERMKFWHHGSNHPVQEVETGRVFITSQNHSFSVDQNSLPPTLRITHRSLFDGTLQGIAHKIKPAIAFQGHPEASPGPHDMYGIFKDFMKLMRTPYCTDLPQSSGGGIT